MRLPSTLTAPSSTGSPPLPSISFALRKRVGASSSSACAMLNLLTALTVSCPAGERFLAGRDDRIRERADAVDLDGDDVARLQIAGALDVVALVGLAADLGIGGPRGSAGGPRLDQDSRLKRVEVGEERRRASRHPRSSSLSCSTAATRRSRSVRSPSGCGSSISSRVTIHGPIGAHVSKFLPGPRRYSKPPSGCGTACRSRAVTSFVTV